MSLGAGGRNRTDMPLRTGDFESPASTSFTTPARARLYRRMPKSQAKIYVDNQLIPMLREPHILASRLCLNFSGVLRVVGCFEILQQCYLKLVGL